MHHPNTAAAPRSRGMFHGRGSVGVALRDQVGQDIHVLASQDDLSLIGCGQAHALTCR